MKIERKEILMKKFENPMLEVEKLVMMDVITTSCEDVPDCGDDLGLA